jgi:glycosyltransferase involved in cell wall biosynthesis
MTSDFHKISILMNSHNGAKYINDSVGSIIAQTHKNWELVFFDNCSDDDSKNILKKFNDNRIKYFYSKKLLTLGQARKNAENYLNGDFIAILDVDDLWLPNKLKNQIEILLKNMDTSFVFTAVNFFNKSNSKNFFPYKKFIKKTFLKNYFSIIECLLSLY